MPSSKTVNLDEAPVMIVMRPAELGALIQQAVEAALQTKQPELMSAEEIGEKLDVSPDLVRLWARQGCPHIRAGKKKLRFRLDAVVEWLESRDGEEG